MGIGNYSVDYKGANTKFLKGLLLQQQRNIFCSCIQPQYNKDKKFPSAENDPRISNAQRISQIISAGPAIGGKVIYTSQNVYGFDVAPGFRNKLSSPIRNKF